MIFFFFLIGQLIFGLGTPLQLDRESVIVGAFSKMMYNLPTNVSQIVISQKPNGRLSRWSLYKKLGKLAELYGLSDNGRACVLRAICEVALVPFESKNGPFQQLLQLFFS